METELDHTKRLALTIKERIESASSEERYEILEELYKKWIIQSNNRNNLFDYLRLALHNFGLEPDNLQMGLFERAKKVVLYEINYLHLQFMQEDIEDEDDRALYQGKFNKLFTAVVDADNAIGSCLYLVSGMTQEDIGTETRHSIFRFTEMDYESNKSHQNLFLYLMEQLKRKGYRRYVVEGNGMCYQRIFTEDGYDTHAWKPAMTVREFVLDSTRKDYNPKMWKNSTDAKDNIKASTNYLTEVLSTEFEDLTRDRHVFSFKNGIYITKRWDEETESFTDQWIPYSGPKSKKIGSSIVSCKLFDYDLDDCSEYDDWFDIIRKHCPNLVNVMEYQHWSGEVQSWLCILIGRLLFSLGDLDDWQILPYLLGVAGTGKSSILMNIVKKLYEPVDVGILSNNMERKFGLSSLADKKIFIGPEIKGNLGLEQAEFQSMISGEDIQINTKFKQAHSQVWKIPGMLAGNEVPQYTDNSGSITRRIAVFPFDYKVQKGDTKLGQKLQKEIPYIIQASTRGYLDAIDRYGSSDIWSILPAEFKEAREQMAENTNSLTNFLRSEHVTLGDQKKVYCREGEFIGAFNEHCRESHLTTNKWTAQYYSGPFGDHNVKVVKNCRRRYPNKPGEKSYNGTFILGVDLIMTQQVKKTLAELEEETVEEEVINPCLFEKEVVNSDTL